jgi:GNAT superfamily N-acetyltransferase
VFKSRYADAMVHPDHRGRGIGAALSGWTQDLARAGGGTLVGLSVPSGGDAEHLKPGYAIREIRAGDEQAAYQLIEDAFNEWPDRQPKSFDDWAVTSVLRPGFEPWQLRLVCDPAGTPVGVAFLIVSGDCGFVDRLAVRADQRGLGLVKGPAR